MESIVGIMWAKNEADIIRDIIEDALSKVDTLFIGDDDSNDGTWEIIKEYSNKLGYFARREDQNKNQYPDRLWAKQHLLDVIRSRYKEQDVLVQIVEGDMVLLDTDIRDAFSKYSNSDVALDWHTINAVRPKWEGKEYEWPKWSCPIQEILTHGHWMELMTYTFRPLKGINFENDFRPWPRGFSKYLPADASSRGKKKREDSPLLAHYGYRGPVHMYNKHKGINHPKNPTWDMSSPKRILETVHYFNGTWNTGKDVFEMGRAGWKAWLTGNV